MAAKESNTLSVKMNDGRTVSFGQRQKLDKELLTRDGLVYAVRFNFRNGESAVLILSDVPAVTQAQLTGHGASQKVGDECADLDSIDDMIEAVVAMIDRLHAGNWTAERQGFAGQSILIEALIEVTKQTRDAVRATLKTLTAKEKAALKTDPTVKAVYDRLESARAKDVDTSKLLGKFAS